MKACFECGLPAEHDHHVVPIVYGGHKTIPLCAYCHGKAHHTGMAKPELIRKGLANAKAAGVRLGAPPKLTEEVRARAAALHAQGVSRRDIARALGISTGSVHAALKGEAGKERQRLRAAYNAALDRAAAALERLQVAEERLQRFQVERDKLETEHVRAFEEQERAAKALAMVDPDYLGHFKPLRLAAPAAALPEI